MAITWSHSGPYWQWSYRPAGGKTVTRKLDERQAQLYQECIANRRRLLDIVAEMEEVSHQAAEILLARPPVVTSSHAPDQPARRVTRPLAEALTRLAGLVEPAADAAQEWLDAKDDDDRRAVAETRDQLLATLDGSAELIATVNQLARLLRSTPPRL